MSIQSITRTRPGAVSPRLQVDGGAPVPSELEEQLTAMSLPSQQHTPMGDAPTGVIDTYIRKLRKNKAHPWRMLLGLALFKVKRGQDRAQVAAPFELAAAVIVDPPTDVDSKAVSRMDGSLEAESRAAWEDYAANPCDATRERVEECESREIAISRQAIAVLRAERNRR